MNLNKFKKNYPKLLSFLISSCLAPSLMFGQYCPATNTDCAFEYITNFSISSITNASGCGAAYDNYTSQVATMMKGVAYDGTISKNGTVANYLATVFVDWNQNGTFDLTGEDYPATLNAAQNGFTFSITPPAGATLGNTRIRVRMVQNAAPPACGAAARGDVEDYTANVVASGLPANNTCATANTITPNSSCIVTNGTTTNSTQQYPPTACSGNTAGAANDVWYSFVADGVKNYTINVTGVGGFNPVLGFYNNCGTPTPVNCADATTINGTETINVGVLTAGTYYYRVYGNGGTGNFTTCVTFPGPLTYCAATNTDCNFEYITNVSLVTINNNSQCDAAYDDFTAQSTTVAIGQSYNGTITKNGNVATYLASIYIDWNQNGIFDVPSEEIQAQPNAATTGFDYTVTPPGTALLGNTRMRIRMVQFSNTPAPCGATTRGDIEDYTLNVTNIVTPPNDDCASAITVNPTSGCTQVNGFTSNGAQQFPPTNCSGTTAATANDVWYKFTANGTDKYQIQTTGTGGFNPVLGLYTSCAAGSLVICKDTSGADQTEIINAGVLAAGTYYYRIYGNGATGTFNTCVLVTSTTGLNYCTATNTDCGFEYITFVGLTTIGNTTDCGDPYDNFTSQIAYLNPGQTYTGHIKKSDILTNYTCSVFIDWNQNGVFDVTETINATSTGTSTYNFTVIPPIGAPLGNTRMRVRMVQNAVPDACNSAARGDVEDYTVNLSASSAPTPGHDDCSGAMPIIPTTSCGNQPGGSTVGATQQYPATLCDGSTPASANDVWFSFQANGTSGYQITINPDANFDPIISLYNACNVNNRIDCEDLVGQGLIENLFTGVLPAGTYYYRVYGKGAAGTFAHCLKELLPQDEYDCQSARVLCNKNPIAEASVLGYGLDGAESYGSCLAAGVGLDANTEENSKWYTWTASNNGALTFDIIPRDVGFGPNDSLDVDFVIYELDPALGCAGKIQLRCMASSCKGATGLNMTATDVTESPDCLPAHDKYLQALTQTTGKKYALMINNFDLPSRGYDLYFGGTATFKGSEPAFTAVANSSCTYPKTVTVTDASLGTNNTYNWNFGAGASPPTATTAGPHTVSYSTAGPKTISLTLTSENDCDSTLTRVVNIADTLSGTVTVTPSTCEQANGQVVINKTGGYGLIGTFSYRLDGGAYQASNTFTGLTPGSHSVTIRDSVNCTKTISFNVSTTLVPIVNDIANVSICDNYTLPTITGINLTGNESYYTGSNGTGTAFSAGSLITSSMMLYIHDSTSTIPTCRGQQNFNITINTEPTVTNISLTCNGSSDYTVSFDINGGNGTYTVQENAPGMNLYNVMGNTWMSGSIPSGVAYDFDVDDANGCGPIKVSGVKNCACPTSTGTMGTASLRVCGNGPATATYNSSGEFNDGNDVLSYVLHTQSGGVLGTVIQTNSTPTFSFIGGMTYGTTYYISAAMGDNNGSGGTNLSDPCLSLASGQPVSWIETPTASFSGTAEICNGGSTPLTFNLTGVGPFSVTYSNGVTNTTLTNLSNGAIANVSPTQTRTYSLVSIVSSTTTCMGTVNPATVTVTVNNAPTVSAPTYTCNANNDGYSVSFTASGGSGNYNAIEPGVAYGGMFMGNVYTSNDIPSGASYNIEVDDDKGCGPVIVQGTHTCACITNAGSMGSQKITVCGPGSITANHNTTNLSLDGNDVLQFVLHTSGTNILGTVLGTSASSSFSFGGGVVYGATYYISAIAGNNDGSGNVDLNDPCSYIAVGTPVQWNEIPTTTASAQNTNICVGDSIKLFASNYPGGNYSWSGPSSFSNFSQNPIRLNATTNMSGNYTVTVTADGCSSSSDINVTVNARPNSSILNAPTGPFCSDVGDVQFTAVTPGGVWSGPGIANPSQGQFNTIAAGPGTHVITYSFGGVCPSSTNKTVIVNETPVFDFSSDIIDGCSPLSVNFANTYPGADTYAWDFGDGSAINATSSPTHIFQAGNYDVSLTITKNGCTTIENKPMFINVYLTPIALFSTIVDGQEGNVVFQNNSTGGTSYTWDLGDGQTSTDFSPEHQYGTQGTYNVTLEVVGDGMCMASITLPININTGTTLFAPNAFTPNGDPTNQYFLPVISGDVDFSTYRFQIFNRWGELMFESKDPTIGWDGTFNNTLCPFGIYTYTIYFKNESTDKKNEVKGTLTLIR